MRRFALAILFFALAPSVFAAHRVSVGQLEQGLAALRSETDAEAARQIAELKLTERLSWARRGELEKTLPGDKSREALRGLADESEFLPPPSSEIPSQQMPDFAAQRQIMGRVVAYVSETIPLLPNFLATRVTQQYEDTPLLVASGQAHTVPYEPLHYVATQTAEVSYEDGKESQGGAMNASASPSGATGLTTWGVFGPILSTVLLDAAQSKLSWSRWEQGADGVRAVFSYAVPRAKSHYEVVYCCVAEQAGLVAADVHMFRQLEGYHGEISVDPATGGIRRLTVEADLKDDCPIVKASIMVEYGPVEIGGRMYTCPLRSVSSSRAESVQVDPNYHFAMARQLQPLKNELADVTFEDYHVFRAETRVLTEAQALAEKAAPAQQTAVQAPGAPLPDTMAAVPTKIPAANAGVSVAGAAPYEPMLQQRPPALVAAAGEPEVTATDATSLPDRAMAAQMPLPNTGFTLRTTTRLVEVAVVATDKRGHPITDLKPQDLEIYDDGRREAVKDFAQAGADVQMTAQVTQETAAAGEPVVTNRPAAGQQDTRNTTVLLIDAVHVAFSDLTYARGEILRFLKAVPADERVGLYTLRSYGFQVLLEPTGDHGAVASALARWTPSAQDMMRAQDEEQRNREQIDSVHSLTDLASLNGNGEGGSDPEMYSSGGFGNPAFRSLYSHAPDAQLRAMGDRPEDFALHLLVGVGRHLAAIPGHKILVWISSDNVLADWSGGAVGEREDTGNQFLYSTALRARETLNEAHVSIYPLDVSELEGGGINAQFGNANVGVVGLSSRDPSLGTLGSINNVNGNGRDAARMHQDTHPIQPAFRELAEATGGRALRRAGDIAAELNSIVADGRAAYLLSFTPDIQADGKYHALTVKCLRPGVTLRFRNGYLYAQEPATMKDRFREVVWQPRDENEIGLTAATVKEAKGPAVRLNIAATDLELAEQDGRWTGKVDVFLVARDDSGLHAAVTGKRLGLALTPATYQRDMRDGLTMEESLPKMPPGTLLRLIVIDENSRRMGSVTVGTAGNVNNPSL